MFFSKLCRVRETAYSLCDVILIYIVEGDPESFTVRYLEGPFCIGIPFQIPLEFADKMGNMTKPDVNTLSPVLELRYLRQNSHSNFAVLSYP